MTDGDWLAERFEEHRGRLRAIAYRMRGSSSDADDAVQEARLRFSCADTSDVHNLGSWLTTVVSRVCVNMLEARRSRRLVYDFTVSGDRITAIDLIADPERLTRLDLVVLEASWS
jgi:DNA-directed RNA polymerase specialized sigma24 family protein